ncbi:unnamed protein product [Dibothriocephalus latus]|uniref:RRM domain-containing protein n=1 Tax=Dibothriocephalus latus TaxID=60516 RepID=A0A3P7P2F8_DIBLA|nr:unnamed protein product [Dibothriocephalus latus]
MYRKPTFRRKVEWDIDPNKISVGSLPDLLKDFHLHEYFSKFGIIRDIFVSQGQGTYRLGFVTFRDVDSVKKVLGNQPHQLSGTQVTVSLAKSKRSADNGCPKQNDTGCSKTEDAFADTEDLLLDKEAVDFDPNYATILVSQLKPKATEADLRAYFSKFGTVAEVEIKINRATGESRGFGFVTYLDRRSIDSVLNTCHFLDKCRIKVQQAIRHGMSRDHNMHPFNRKMQWKFNVNKIFIRALPKSIKDFHLHEYFSKFGIIKDVFVSEGQDARRCGFITFRDMDSARRVLDNQPHLLNETQITVSLGKVKQSAETE